MNFKEFGLKLDKLMTEEKENNQENNKQMGNKFLIDLFCIYL